MLITLLLSGGVGKRMGNDLPKQYLSLDDRLIISYSLQTLNAHPEIDYIVIVAEPFWRDIISRQLSLYGISKFLSFANPGQTRQYSILSGLHEIHRQGGAQTVLIHDAARPFLSTDLITRCLVALPGHDGVMPALSAKDTFYLKDSGGRISGLLDRSALAAGQTPEVFDFQKYYSANMSMSEEEMLSINGSTEVAFLGGMDIVTVEGDERNIKITTPDDLRLAEKYLAEER